MGFLRTLFWIVLTVIVVVLSLRNWVPVTINLFGNVQAEVKLPVLLLLAALAGFIPGYGWQRWKRWRQARAMAAAPPAPIVTAPIGTAPPAGETGIGPARAD